MGDLTPQYVCIHVPEFPAQARLRLRPAQARTPVAILQGEPPLEEVCSATKKARRLGVANGMTRAQLEAFPGLAILPRSAAEERSTHTAVLSAASAFTPRVQCVPVPGSLTCVLDMTGAGLIFGDAPCITRSVAQAMHALGLRARLAVSANFHAAVSAAPFAERIPKIIPQGREGEHLGPLPVSSLRVSEQQAAMLDLWGIRTLAELAALPEVELVVRLGQEGKRLHALALGEHPHLMVPEEPVFTLDDFLEFDSPEDRLEALLFVAGPMLDQLIARAQMHALSLASLVVTLPLDGGGEHTRTLKPALPLADRTVFLKLMHLDLHAHPPPAAVMGLRLHAEPGRRGRLQMGLFSPQLPEAARLDVTLAQVEAMVGEGRIGSPRLLDTHRPDGFTMERFAIPAKNPPAKNSAAEPQRPSSVLRRLRPPLPLNVWLDELSRRPASFFFEQKRYRVAEAYGPWRQSGDWWSERVWSREEWDVRATCGTGALLCVLVHDLLAKQWQLEAVYD